MAATLVQLNEQFLDECRYSGKLRCETLRGYKASFDLLLKFKPEMSIKDLKPETMTGFFSWLENRQRTVGKGIAKKGVKNSTVATYRNKLSKFFKWLQDRKLLRQDPFLGVPYPHVIYSDRKFLKKENVEKIFTTLGFNIDWSSSFIKRRNIAMYTVLLHCGLRKGELIGLKLLDIDFDHTELLVRAETSKSKIDRYIPLNSKVTTALKEYIEERRKGHYTTPYLWVSEQGDRPFTLDGFKHLNQKVEASSGVDFHPHQFRHTFAVNMLHSGTDAFKLKQLMGHADIRMTAAYLRALPTHSMQRDVERLSMSKLL
jgi:site-specific recombinase XerD